MTETVAVIVAHPDDEVLGCGGTIARHIAEGDEVSIIIMTDGVSARESQQQAAQLQQRQDASVRALAELGIDEESVHRFNFPDNQLDTLPLLEVTQTIEKELNKIQPSVVYTHYAQDLNIDHRIVNQAVLTACRPQPGSPVKKLLTFEVLSSTEWQSKSYPTFTPNYIVDISNYWESKLRALKQYDEEIRSFPHSRSYETIKSLATTRGAMYGLQMAESFYIERCIR
ncbi:PIG-L deacetylase family protein [Dongshaea marina]|uniref:PIG-L deacetylase family protein n=1 Tax=Dongshaea marina TaxID=2047966 RepID=UPI000D3ECE47|nr:PIG-L family deacetylase [Dongshaea marina]